LIRINLSPKKLEKKKENLRLQVWIFVLTLTVAAASCFWVYTSTHKQVRRLEQERDRIQAESSRLASVINLSKSISEQRVLIDKRVGSIRKLDERRALPFQLLVALRVALTATEPETPPGEVSSINVAERTGLLKERVSLSVLEIANYRVSIEGYATDNTTITQYIKRLKGMNAASLEELRFVRDFAAFSSVRGADETPEPVFRSVQLAHSTLKTVPVTWEGITIRGQKAAELEAREYTGARRVSPEATVRFQGLKSNESMESFFDRFGREYVRNQQRLAGYAEQMREEFARRVMSFKIALLLNERLADREQLMSYCDTPSCEQATSVAAGNEDTGSKTTKSNVR